ncbi:MAG: hypothetical protein ABEJ22_09425 [Haloferacaceae archaeon]
MSGSSAATVRPSALSGAVSHPFAVQTAVGGSPAGVLLAMLTTAVLVVLSLVVAYEAVRGYRGSDDPALLTLAVGIVLVSAGPTFATLVLTNLTATAGDVVTLVQRVAELLGLLTMLYAMYYDG